MELTESQFSKISHLFPAKRGKLSISDYDVMKAVLYIAEHGCKWRGLPARFGRWHTIYMRVNRWAKNGLLDRVFASMQEQDLIRVKVEVVSLDSTIVKVHPDGSGALKKTGSKASANHVEAGPQRFIWLPQMLAQQ